MMKAAHLTGLAGLCLSLACGASEHAMEFDVPYGNYGTYFQQDVGKEGRLSRRENRRTPLRREVEPRRDPRGCGR